jgi:hypothetical protein
MGGAGERDEQLPLKRRIAQKNDPQLPSTALSTHQYNYQPALYQSVIDNSTQRKNPAIRLIDC